jgi:hypothetical protein
MRVVKAWLTAAMAIGSLVLSGYAATATITTREPQATVATPATSTESTPQRAPATATEATTREILAGSLQHPRRRMRQNEST